MTVAETVAAAKVIAAYAKENEKLTIVGGAMGENTLDVAGIQALATLPFYRDCARVLGDDGILVVNLWGGDRNFNACVDRLRAAFDGRVLCLPAGKPGNIAAFAFKSAQGEPRWDELTKRARALTPHFGLTFGRFVEEFKVLNPHNDEALLI